MGKSMYGKFSSYINTSDYLILLEKSEDSLPRESVLFINAGPLSINNKFPG